MPYFLYRNCLRKEVMQEANYLGFAVEKTQQMAAYDAHAKALLSDATILSWILKYTMKEFASYEIEEIKACISEREIGERVFGDDTQSKDLWGRENDFDIRFHVYTPEEEIKILLNLEAQRKFHPGYDIATRGIFYGARMITEQMNVEFDARDYDGLKKVVSIWICVDCPKDVKGRIVRYRMQEEMVHGESFRQMRYDLLDVILVCLNDDTRENHALVDVLSTLLSETLTAQEKREILEGDYRIPLTREVDEEVHSMCDLSYGVLERGIRQGIEQGVAQEQENTRAALARADAAEAELEQLRERLTQLEEMLAAKTL